MKRLATWAATWKLIAFRPQSFAGMTLLYLTTYATHALPGLVLKRVFDALSGPAYAGANVWTLVAVLALVQLANVASDYAQVFPEEEFRCYGWALLRGNIVRNALRRPGAAHMTVAPGDAVNRLHYDVMELADWPSWLPYVAGQLLMSGIAVATMLGIAPRLTAVAAVPFVIVIATVRLARQRMLGDQQRSLEAGSRVSGFLGEVLDAIGTVKAASSERNIIARLDELNADRRRSEVRYNVLLALLNWAHTGAAEVILGIVLLLAAGVLRRGNLTVGELVLFVTYLRIVVDVPAGLGGFFADYETQANSIDRLQELQPDAPPASLVDPLPVHLWQPQPAHKAQLPPRRPLTRFEASALTYGHPDVTNGGARHGPTRSDSAEAPRLHATGRPSGIVSIDLQVHRGEFVVVTGRVGSGKTTLLRVLLGLLPVDQGEIRWNGLPVASPGDVLVPPLCAYTPQVPRLFSATLRDNILLGVEASDEALDQALHLAVLMPDVRELPNGLDTLVGPRGMRLSGGQVQRVAAARMLVRRPELLVVDDISSALDVETEALLWRRILGIPGGTCLAVSHRQAVLQHADRILVLKNGRLDAVGTFAELLATNAELQAICRGQIATG